MKKTVLTVDDSDSVLKMLSFILEMRGYEVIGALNGYEALEKLDGRRIDLIITDLIMPGLDGIELIMKIKKNPAYCHVPVVMETTQSDLFKVREGKNAGVSAWVVKPFKPAQLLAVVHKLLR